MNIFSFFFFSVNCCRWLRWKKNHLVLGTPVDRDRWLLSRHLRAAVNSLTVTSSPHCIPLADGRWFCASTIPNSSSTMLCGKMVGKLRPVLASMLLSLLMVHNEVHGRLFVWCRRWRRTLSIILPTIASPCRNEQFESLNGSDKRRFFLYENRMLILVRQVRHLLSTVDRVIPFRSSVQ